MDYEKIYAESRVASLSGRYISPHHLAPLFAEAGKKSKLETAGYSVLGQPIYQVEIGTGPVRLLFWSQMHGNESTTTKAVFDLLGFLKGGTFEAETLKSKFTFLFIPMLNPDGAAAYTRVNARQVDLNRDFQLRSQPETAVLFKVYAEFKPDFCYNLHDQRTIFGVANTGKPATVSFLSPAFNEARELNATRLKAIGVINAMNQTLQGYLPGQVGRFDDTFNLNCAGDTFQSLGTPTILIEAGHFQQDYDRELTRKFVFFALLSGFEEIYEIDVVNVSLRNYLRIPQNMTNFFDFVYKNVKINYENSEIIATFASQFTETLIENKIVFNAFIAQIGNLEGFFGHCETEWNGAVYSAGKNPEVGDKADFSIGGKRIVNGRLAE